MALINCPDCGEQISDSVEKCVHCGRVLTQKDKTKIKIDSSVTETKAFVDKNKKLLKKIVPIILAVIAVGVIVYALWYNSGTERARRLAETDAATLNDTYEQLYGSESNDYDFRVDLDVNFK